MKRITINDIFDGNTEAQARCAALIWPIKEGHLKAEDLKL